MQAITNADNPDLTRFLVEQQGKLILWHGWADAGAPPEPTLDYYKDVVATTFDDEASLAAASTRLFMFPGVGHCRGGDGPDQWDPLTPLVNWVENGSVPDSVVATHATDGVVDNERPICAYPQTASYSGPAGGQDNPANWVATNFSCR